jgi:hypothetical protein
MDSSDTQSPHTPNDEQIAILVSVAMEEFGSGLTHTQFNDVMLALFEHIPGFETLPHKRSVWYLKLMWFKYQQAALANQSRH